MGTSCLSDITPLTLLDYPGKTACIFWFSLCNLRCKYCYNTSFIKGGREGWNMVSAVDFLKERAGFLEGVVLSGGECTLYPGLTVLAKKIRDMGYMVKVDTNGTQPGVVKRLVEEGLADYIALDYKASRENFGRITGRALEYEAFSETLDFLISRDTPFEVRTTIYPDLTDEEEINRIQDDLYQREYKGTHFLQYYFHTDRNLGNLKETDRDFNVSSVRKLIPVELRNFPDR